MLLTGCVDRVGLHPIEGVQRGLVWESFSLTCLFSNFYCSKATLFKEKSNRDQNEESSYPKHLKDQFSTSIFQLIKKLTNYGNSRGA